MSLGKKGQASIELILLLAVVLLLVQTIILPSFEAAQKASSDVSSMAIVRSQAQKLANAIDLVGSSNSGAKQTIHLVVPAHAKIGCDSNPPIMQIYYQVQPYHELGVPEVCKHDSDFSASFPSGNNEDLCTGIIPLSLSTGMTFDCGTFSSDVLKRFDSNSISVTVQIVNASDVVSLNLE
ncbi:MAG: hypothetical protein Q7R70_00480 [Candidatus Diapherotrites archaeon]|nr:hypothetical protein [Candidatus Diapherotrites archaeon]